ncbi:MAG: peptidoglycan-binding protein [Myxococcota bacterium]
MTIPIQGTTGTTLPQTELQLGGSTEDLIGYFQLRMKDQSMNDPAQREAFMNAFKSVIQGLSAMPGNGLNPAAKNALLQACADPSKSPQAVLQGLQAQGINTDTFTSRNPLVDAKVMSRGQNLGVYTQGPSLDQVASGNAVMHIGHSGEGVKELQRKLNAMGAHLDVDGKFGPKTEAALKSFCAAKGLSPDGVLDASKLGVLNKGGEALTDEQWNKFQPNYAADKARGAVDAQEVYAERARTNGPARVTGDDGKPLPAGTKGLLEQISRGEGTTDAQAQAHGYKSGYDVTLANGKFGGGPNEKPVSSMTLGEVKQLQARMLADPRNGWNSSAVGKYQIVGTTLRGLQKEMGLSDDTVFSPELQDKMATRLLQRRGMDRFTSGQMSAAQFQNNIASEWASFARADTGASAYGQHTGTSSAQAAAAIAGLRTA